MEESALPKDIITRIDNIAKHSDLFIKLSADQKRKLAKLKKNGLPIFRK